MLGYAAGEACRGAHVGGDLQPSQSEQHEVLLFGIICEGMPQAHY